MYQYQHYAYFGHHREEMVYIKRWMPSSLQFKQQPGQELT